MFPFSYPAVLEPWVLESSVTTSKAMHSPRLELARIAQEVTSNTSGVVAMWSDPLKTRVTLSGRERVEGVVLAAEASGGYEMTLYLVVAMVPLYPLAETVRKRIWRAAEAEGLDRQLARVDIVIEDLVGAKG